MTFAEYDNSPVDDVIEVIMELHQAGYAMVLHNMYVWYDRVWCVVWCGMAWHGMVRHGASINCKHHACMIITTTTAQI